MKIQMHTQAAAVARPHAETGKSTKIIGNEVARQPEKMVRANASPKAQSPKVDTYA